MAKTPAGRFEEQVLCHLDLVYRFAFKLTRNPHEAEELTQETFLRAHRAFDQFEFREYGAKPWLLKILINVAHNRRARQARAPTLMTDLNLEDFAAELDRRDVALSGEARIDWETCDEELKQAIDSLSPDYRAVLLLWALGDLSYKEIAGVLGVALGTVMSRLHRARQQLNESLADYAAERRLGQHSRSRP